MILKNTTRCIAVLLTATVLPNGSLFGGGSTIAFGETTEKGCCSLNFKTCIDWCGQTKDSCLNCDHHDGVGWLPNGKQEQCKRRWKGCENDMNGCCDGLTCQKNENDFFMCMPSRESELFSPPNTRGPTTPPTEVSSPPATDPSNSPTTTNPIIVSSVSPTKAPNTSPTTKEELTGDGCCSLDFKTCINWCGPTKDSCLNCNHHDDVFWLPNGKPKEKCRKRWKGCKNDMNGCCDGLTCQENENNFLMCMPSLELDVESPSKVPNASPTTKPTTKEELSEDGCCSLNFKTCINWCGPTKDSCLNCDHHDGVFWLPNGKPQEKCKKRWKGCKNDMNGCCDGLTCRENENNFLMCLPFLELEDSSPPAENPTNSPMVPTVAPTLTPTFNPTKPPTKSPTESPTKSPTTENPTSKPNVIPTEYPTFTPTTFTPTVSESASNTITGTTGSLRGADNRKM